jgi:hypothetical protein
MERREHGAEVGSVEGGAMNTFWTVITVAFVVAVVAIVAWVFLIAPLIVPGRAVRR